MGSVGSDGLIDISSERRTVPVTTHERELESMRVQRCASTESKGKVKVKVKLLSIATFPWHIAVIFSADLTDIWERSLHT